MIDRQQKLITIQVARGVAALLVVLMHSGHMLSLEQYVGYVPLQGVFSFGHAGVDFFFVLSGFIIYYVHHSDIDRSERLPRYAWRRFSRIYPVYWIVTAAAIALLLVHHDLPSVWSFVASVLLLPQSDEPIVGVAWTLEHEVLFYALFSQLIISRRVGIAVFAAWAALIALGFSIRLPGLLPSFLGSSYHVHFFLGIASAHLVLTKSVRFPLTLAVIGAAIFFVTGLVEDGGVLAYSGPIARLLFGIGSAMAIAGLATAERANLIRIGAAGEFFGGASYSLYLIHTTVIGLTAHALAAAGIVRAFPGWTVLVLCVTTSVIASWAVYKFIEYPLLVRLQTSRRDKPAMAKA